MTSKSQRRVAGRAVDEVDEDARPLDVAEEGVAQARPGRGAFDESRHVGDRGAAILVVAEVHDPEVRLERGERVRRDLRVGRRQGGEER